MTEQYDMEYNASWLERNIENGCFDKDFKERIKKIIEYARKYEQIKVALQ